MKYLSTLLLIAGLATTAFAEEPVAAEKDGKISSTNGITVVPMNDNPIKWSAKQVTKTYIGVSVTKVSKDLQKHLQLEEGLGLSVDVVAAKSPAAKAGLQAGDVILQVNDQLLAHPEQFAFLIARHEKGDVITLAIKHAGQDKALSVTLGEHQVYESMRVPNVVLPGLEGFFCEENAVTAMEKRKERMQEKLQEKRQHNTDKLDRHDAVVEAMKAALKNGAFNSTVRMTRGPGGKSIVITNGEMTVTDNGKVVYQGPVDAGEAAKHIGAIKAQIPAPALPVPADEAKDDGENSADF